MELKGAPRDSSERRLSPRLERFGERTEDFVDTVESAITQAIPKPVRKRRDPRDNTIINVIWRALVLLVGLALVVVGILLLLLPGPGWATILLGLVVLASEYTWANRLLAPVRRRVRQGAEHVSQMPRGARIAIYAAVGAGLLASVLAFGWFAARALQLA